MFQPLRFGRRLSIPSKRQIIHEMRMLQADEECRKATPLPVIAVEGDGHILAAIPRLCSRREPGPERLALGSPISSAESLMQQRWSDASSTTIRLSQHLSACKQLNA